MWEGVVAVVGMCVRAGRAGLGFHRGELRGTGRVVRFYLRLTHDYRFVGPFDYHCDENEWYGRCDKRVVTCWVLKVLVGLVDK